MPELQTRTMGLINLPDTNPARIDGLILSGHSQGAVICAAVVLQTPRWPVPVWLVTYGCQLTGLYGRVFPGLLRRRTGSPTWHPGSPPAHRARGRTSGTPPTPSGGRPPAPTTSSAPTRPACARPTAGSTTRRSATTVAIPPASRTATWSRPSSGPFRPAGRSPVLRAAAGDARGRGAGALIWHRGGGDHSRPRRPRRIVPAHRRRHRLRPSPRPIPRRCSTC